MTASRPSGHPGARTHWGRMRAREQLRPTQSGSCRATTWLSAMSKATLAWIGDNAALRPARPLRRCQGTSCARVHPQDAAPRDSREATVRVPRAVARTASNTRVGFQNGLRHLPIRFMPESYAHCVEKRDGDWSIAH